MRVRCYPPVLPPDFARQVNAETVTLTAANGDMLELGGDGVACTGGGSSTGGGVLAVTGGTGRFRGTHSSLSERFVHELASGFETSELSGTISAPGVKP